MAGNVGFLAHEGDTWSLYRWDMNKEPVLILSSPVIRDWDVASDQKRIAYSTTDGQLYLYDLTTEKTEVLNKADDDWQNPVFLNDTELLVVKNVFGPDTDDSDLLIIDTKTKTIAKEYQQTGAEEMPALGGKDNQLISYIMNFKDAFNNVKTAIWLMDLKQKQTMQLTAFESDNLRPQLTPEGQGVTWIRRDGRTWKIIHKDLKTEKTETLWTTDRTIDSFIYVDASTLAILISDAGTTEMLVLNTVDHSTKQLVPLGKGLRLREIGLWD